jgi:hypothetical protein
LNTESFGSLGGLRLVGVVSDEALRLDAEELEELLVALLPDIELLLLQLLLRASVELFFNFLLCAKGAAETSNNRKPSSLAI